LRWKQRQAAAIISNSLDDLAAEVRNWLQAIRYRVDEPERLDSRKISIVAALDEGTVKQRVRIHCIGGEIMLSDLDDLKRYMSLATPQGWLISDRRVSTTAQAKSGSDATLQVFTLADFLGRMIWGPYFSALKTLVEDDRIPELYVDLACYKEVISIDGTDQYREVHNSLDVYLDGWLKERGKSHISILGEFGTGKTWFCRHYAYRQLSRYLDDPVNERLPLLITLRDFTKAMTAQQLINDALLEQYKLPFVGSAYEIFREMNRRGKLLLILDGFDEMARQVDYQTVVDNFWELAKLVEDGSKVVLTSRTEYFRWSKESERVLAGEEFGRRTIQLKPPRFEVLYLEPFNKEQIQDVIIRRLGPGNGLTRAERILAMPNLAEMARKPVLVELLLVATDDVSASSILNVAQVYLFATNKLIFRNISTKRTFTKTADKLYFLCELAWEMIRNNELRIHYSAIPERIKAFFGDRIKDQHELDMWDFDLRGQTLLHRNAAGYYEFAHRSLAEYFVALKFAAELGCLSSIFAQTYRENDGKQCKLPMRKKNVLGLSDSFGSIKLSHRIMSTVRELLSGMMKTTFKRSLWKLVQETRTKPPEQIRYTGGNAATLLLFGGKSFANAKLSRSVLTGAYFVNADLQNTDLRGSCLREVNLTRCNLAGADLRHTDLSDVEIERLSDARVLAWSPNGSRLASGHYDSTATIWTPKRKEVLILEEHSHWVWGLCFSPDGKFILTAGGQLKKWDAFTGKEIFTADVPDTTDAAQDDSNHIVSVDYKPDGKCFAGGDNVGNLFFWHADGKLMKQWRGHSDGVLSVRYSADGTRVATAGRDKLVCIWDATNGSNLAKLETARGYNYSLVWEQHGENLISGGRELYIWNVRKRKKTATLRTSFTETFCLALRSRDRLLACGGSSSDGHVELWDTEKSHLVQRLSGHPEYFETHPCIFGATFSPDGRNLATCGTDGTIKIWDVHSGSAKFGECIRILEARLNCRATKIAGAKGLDKKASDEEHAITGTLLEFLEIHGAVLDKQQKAIAAKSRAEREKIIEKIKAGNY
jgi:hypothetical protein